MEVLNGWWYHHHMCVARVLLDYELRGLLFCGDNNSCWKCATMPCFPPTGEKLREKWGKKKVECARMRVSKVLAFRAITQQLALFFDNEHHFSPRSLANFKE
ncbi:hypothetical protein CDAR_32731 [Caerostris darwini]|uniref:Uncharacterized protein n=1 Tax=Caerostris darwini TaxID=1538125 RepID=A0AAV4QS60_9ARAC|nr:hypothetical protein CDAR_32731 [Caerostris darwini]